METTDKSDRLTDQNNNLCRVCLAANEDNKCIFVSHVNLDHRIYSPAGLWEKLQFYGGIKISQGDGFPTKMCNNCVSKMQVAHEFRTQCQETDKILRSMLSNGANKNESTSERLRVREGEAGREVSESAKLEDLYSDESNIDAAVEMNCHRVLTNLEKEISSLGKVEDVEQAVNKEKSQTRTILVLKNVNGNGFRRSCQAYDQSPLSLTVQSRNSESVFSECINDKAENIAKKEDKLVLKKEGFRSRRQILFKRATSMTNLKNNKERQRQYIKKNQFGKLESSDRENVQNILPHKCTKCGRSYASKTALELHESNHDYKKFSCDQCDEKFGRLDDFLKHAKSHDLDEKLKPASCKLCNKNFRKAVTMVRHLNVHKRDNPRAVYFILKDIRDRRKVRNTKIPGEDEATTDNLEEKRVFQDKQIADREFYKITSNSLESRCCFPDTSATSSNTDKDVKSSDETHSTSEFTCNVCNTNFAAGDELKSHRRLCGHREGNVSWEQSALDERSAIKLINIWIKEELDSDNEGKGFACENCSKSYATKKSLAKHREKMHTSKITDGCPRCGEGCICGERTGENPKDTREKAFACEECEKTFEKEAKLEKHMRIHARAKEQQDANFKRFLCHICSKTFRQNTGLMFHMRTHTGYKPHVCKYCGRGFTSNSNCINHERTHTGDRPFVCHFCSAAFAKSCTLKAHITTHTGEANYHCKTCGKSFRRLKYLKEHRFTHTGEKPYACKICGTAYSHSGSLFVHEKKCRAQEGNYPAISAPVPQNYRQPSATAGASSMASIITSLPSAHHLTSLDEPLTVDATKNYIGSGPRIHNMVNSTSDGAAHVHLNANADDVSSVVRSYAIVGQMFHT